MPPQPHLVIGTFQTPDLGKGNQKLKLERTSNQEAGKPAVTPKCLWGLGRPSVCPRWSPLTILSLLAPTHPERVCNLGWFQTCLLSKMADSKDHSVFVKERLLKVKNNSNNNNKHNNCSSKLGKWQDFLKWNESDISPRSWVSRGPRRKGKIQRDGGPGPVTCTSMT